ncbi:ribonuclease HII [Ruegeria lacuscaerulensis ITI-1157]|nr:ribonuclease HII [Ruegeria lacuscaerulensis ITI-1157]
MPPFPFFLRIGSKNDFPGHMSTPDFNLEREMMAQGHARVAGVDEVGRGPLAGPVVAAAVILNPQDIPKGLNDSKKLTARRRLALDADLRARSEFSIAEASVAEIDDLNILYASHLAMVRAVAALKPAPDYVLIDGNLIPKGLTVPARAVVRGDAKSVSIAAASILAKNWRDQLMVDLAQQHPGYGWETNAGYPSKQHREALQNLGVTPHHRRSFKPVHNILYQEKNVTP